MTQEQLNLLLHPISVGIILLILYGVYRFIEWAVFKMRFAIWVYKNPNGKVISHVMCGRYCPWCGKSGGLFYWPKSIGYECCNCGVFGASKQEYDAAMFKNPMSEEMRASEPHHRGSYPELTNQQYSELMRG